MTEAMNPLNWSHYPMGPNVRRLIGLDDEQYRGMDSGQPSADHQEQFAQFLLPVVNGAEIPSSEALVDLLEELVAMDFGALALRLADLHTDLFPERDASALIALGNAALVSGDFGRAEICYRDAQELDSNDPTPYVNLTQILYADQRWREAIEWCDTGLEVTPNHRKLWEYKAAILRKVDSDTAPNLIREHAERVNSWAGLSLACELQLPGDATLQAEILGRLYDEGERDGEFLTEYTGALGGAGTFDRIPAIVIQAERFASSGLPWQLYAHSFQANLARGLLDHAEADMKKLQATPQVPSGVISALTDILREARAEPPPTSHH